MDDKTKTMMLTLATGVIKKGLLVAGTSLAGHGIINSNQLETFVSVGMVLVGLGWSFWNDYGKAIVLSQLEVLKAKSLAQAEKMKQSGIAPVTANQIAAQSSTLTSAEVTKTVATLPPAVQATVAKVALVAIVLSCFLAGDPGQAQAQTRKLTGNIVNDLAAASSTPRPAMTGAVVTDVQNFFNARLLPDLQYAQKLAMASKNSITADCYQAWIDIITTQQTAVKNTDGTDIPMPDPHIITEFEKIVELRNALQPESTFMVKCSPVASMVKKDIAGFIGIVISGGAGLATLVPGL